MPLRATAAKMSNCSSVAKFNGLKLTVQLKNPAGTLLDDFDFNRFLLHADLAIILGNETVILSDPWPQVNSILKYEVYVLEGALEWRP